jgi:hypothetical protein
MDNYDIALHRTTELTKSKTLEIRFETFDSFNPRSDASREEGKSGIGIVVEFLSRQVASRCFGLSCLSRVSNS